MFTTNFVQFSNNHTIYGSRCFDGYLAFLPEPVLNDAPANKAIDAAVPDTHLSYRQFSGKDFRWFEFKDTQPASDITIQVSAPENSLWLLINMRSGLALASKDMPPIATDTLLCYQTLLDTHLISIGNRSSWFMLLGMDSTTLHELMDEYTQLKSLYENSRQQDTACHIIGTMHLHAKLKRLLDGLQQMEFRPFSTYYQLANWNIRFFRLVFQNMEPQVVDKIDHEIALYYKAITYIRQNFQDESTNIETISNALYVSKATLKRAFKDKPFAVNKQIVEFRLQAAKELIRNSDQSIASIASSLNFSCARNFKRLFVKRFSLSPLQYREITQLKRIF